MSLYSLGEGIDHDEKESVPISILRERTRGVNTPAEKGCRSFVNPVQLLQRRWWHSVLLPYLTAMNAIAYVLMYTWPPELLMDFAKQLIASAISQVLMDVR